MRSPLQISLVALTALVAQSAAASDYPTVVVVYDGWGTPTSFTVGGRVLEDQGEVSPKKKVSRTESLRANLKALESDEVRFAEVLVTLAGQSFTATTDDDGNFKVQVKGLPAAQALAPGVVPVTVKLQKAPGRSPASLQGGIGEGVLYVQDNQTPFTAVISDVDDTIVKTYLMDRRSMLDAVLLKNATQLEPVEGAAANYRAAQAAGVSAFFYLSGSPQNFYNRIHSYLALQKFPAGPLFLKNFGDDSLLKQQGYKLERLEFLLKEFPLMKVILIGDTGEQDPEIYRELAKRHPARVAGIVIRKTPGSDLGPARLKGMTSFDDKYATNDVIAGLIAASTRVH